MEISHQTLETDLCLVCLSGRFDATTSPKVRTTLRDLIERGYPRMIVDLSEVPFIDSSGLAALVSGLRLAREKGGTVVLSGIQPQAQTVFRLTMLDRIFAIHPSWPEAERSLV